MIYALVRMPAVHPWSNLICMWGMHFFTKYYVWLLFSLGSKFYYINFQDNCLECLSSFLWTDIRLRDYLGIGDLLPVSNFVLWLISYTVLFFNVAVKKILSSERPCMFVTSSPELGLAKTQLLNLGSRCH